MLAAVPRRLPVRRGDHQQRALQFLRKRLLIDIGQDLILNEIQFKLQLDVFYGATVNPEDQP